MGTAMFKRLTMLTLAVLSIIGGTAYATVETVRGDTNARIERAEVDAFNDGFLDGACNERTYEDGSTVWEDGTGQDCAGDVLAVTGDYAPCIEVRATREGRTWYADAVTDTWDDGQERTPSQQAEYVREGCREMTR